jgi:hypothetical protein
MWFKKNLLEIGENPDIYDTHSFRRGGAQYFLLQVGWPITRITNWGGWSEEWNGLTVYRYLTGFLDQDIVNRDQYMDPMAQYNHCNACGRSCACGSSIDAINVSIQ